jgi:hypothetical protein
LQGQVELAVEFVLFEGGSVATGIAATRCDPERDRRQQQQDRPQVILEHEPSSGHSAA